MSYAGTLPYQKNHRGFHKATKDITHIWLECKTNWQAAALPTVLPKYIKVYRLLEAYKEQEIISSGAEDG